MNDKVKSLPIKGDVLIIDRFKDGSEMEYTVQRICRNHINVKYDGGQWAMPYNRLNDAKLQSNEQ